MSTLGKLEISGPDAGAFLERAYTGRFASMAIGTIRYGLMCDESGTIIDDGVVARLAEDRYYVTTTTDRLRPRSTASSSAGRSSGACGVVLTNATGSMAAINLAGPRAREVLEPFASRTSTSARSAFPYLGVRAGRVLGVPARLLRVGFVGELGYEIHSRRTPPA